MPLPKEKDYSAYEKYTYRRLLDSITQTRLVRLQTDLSIEGLIVCDLRVASICRERPVRELRACRRPHASLSENPGTQAMPRKWQSIDGIPYSLREGSRCFVDHESTPQYKAISYTWGTSDDSRQVLIDGRLLEIRLNLWQFLDAYRQRESRDEHELLWIDQICIDQSHIAERSDQVAQMAMIFHGAEEVIGWLGPGSDLDHWAFASIAKCRRSKNHREVCVKVAMLETCPWCFPSWSIVIPGKEVTAGFLANTYWTRLWVVQEIALARHVVWMLGPLTLDNELLYNFCSKRTVNDTDLDHDDVLSNIATISSAHHVPGCQTIDVIDSSRCSLATVLSDHASRLCSDPRDKVFGLLALVTEQQRVNVDYSVRSDELLGQVIDIVVSTHTTRFWMNDFTSFADALGIPARWRLMQEKMNPQSTTAEGLKSTMTDLENVLRTLNRWGLMLMLSKWTAQQQVVIAYLAWTEDPNVFKHFMPERSMVLWDFIDRINRIMTANVHASAWPAYAESALRTLGSRG